MLVWPFCASTCHEEHVCVYLESEIPKGGVPAGLLRPALYSALSWVQWELHGKEGHSPRIFRPSGGHVSKTSNHSGTLGSSCQLGGPGLEPGVFLEVLVPRAVALWVLSRALAPPPGRSP